MNFFDDLALKKIVYTFIAIVIISILVLLGVFMWHGNNKTEEEEFSLATEELENKILINDNAVATSITEDKNIKNEVSGELNTTEENTNGEAVNENKNETESKKEVKEKPKTNTNKELKFEVPVSGEIIKDFANETLVFSKTLNEWTTHYGIDIASNKTSVVKAAEAGKIESIKNDPRYGLTITIAHSNGFKTVYSNLLTTEFVSEGENVEKGDTIATVGESASFEILEDSHLHFEMYKDEVPVNPTIYFK